MTEQQKSSGLAITSLVLGILSIFCGGPLLGIPAIICGLMALSKAKKGEAGGTGMAITGMVTGVVGTLSILLVAAMILPALSKAREKARQANCSGNLKQMSIACLMYSGDYSGMFPLEFETLNTTGYLSASSVYSCPSTGTYDGNATPSTGDYLYFGKGIRDDNSSYSSVVIIADKPGNHDGWINAAFVDGHVEGVKANSIEEAASIKGWIVPGVND